jgi:hypothetical protein
MDDPDFLYPLTTSRSVWGAHCTAPSGGCDASVLGESRDDALLHWNNRAAAREEAPQVGLTDEQRGAIEWAAGRAHVEALGKPIEGVEGKRWRVLSDLFRASAQSGLKLLVNRFLSWPLPQTVAADQCATNPAYPFPRSGTNLLNADEAEAMLQHVLAPDVALDGNQYGNTR